MYIYDSYDKRLLQQRVQQFRDQTARYLDGRLSEDEFRPLRLQNGLYVQRLAPMLRVSIPYGMLSSRQLRALAAIARDYDKGYGHISTRQNIQFNWPSLEDTPDILAALAEVDMHAIQTSGNCVRNVTTDQFAGVAPDEVEDPRPWCEIIRQWATLHPEFSFLPRKFKIAVTATEDDRAAVLVHDIGLQIFHNDDGETRFRVLVGGGLGRTPAIGKLIRESLEPRHLLSYLEAILRIYNLQGRRDNRYKSRIKILVKALGAEEFARRVEAEWAQIKDGNATLDPAEITRVHSFFSRPQYDAQAAGDAEQLAQARLEEPRFDRWLRQNVGPHRVAGYAIVTLSLKRRGLPPGDVGDDEMDAVADLADRYSFGELRTTHEQNLVLADVRHRDLPELWRKLEALWLATPNIGTINDIICCPGGDYCSLANARAIPIAEAIQQRFDNLDYLYDLGNIDLNISGCMNACGHHHVGHIGVLGVDKRGQEFFQISVGGNSGRGHAAAIGTILGPSFASDEVPEIIEKVLQVFGQHREGDEDFMDCFARIGVEPFRAHVYPKAH